MKTYTRNARVSYYWDIELYFSTRIKLLYYFQYILIVVRTPGKPGIHLEFENSTWKTWNLHEKKLKKHLEFEKFQMNFYLLKF